MTNADIEVLPGFNRADLTYLAECLEGVHGDGRRTDAETLEKGGKFVRAAIAVSGRPDVIGLPVVEVPGWNNIWKPR